MTWEIVLGIIALCGFVCSVAAYASKLSRVLATLDTTIKLLDITIKEFKKSSHETHKELYSKLEKSEQKINN